MGFPSHIIMDFNFKKNNYVTPYWVTHFVNNKHYSPNFLNEVLTKELFNEDSNKLNWVTFLKRDNTLSAPHRPQTLNQSLIGNLKVSDNNNPSYTADNLININFLRYERLYTKLKYSRSPAYDIVSGGAAALLAGFFGFLISEKFGFELVDSGDFYYLFMYFVFAAFILKPFLYMSHVNTNILSTLSYRNILNFFIKVIVLVFSVFKKLV
jgi:hypothetical protein